MALRSGTVGGLSRFSLATALLGGPSVVRTATLVSDVAEQTLRATQLPQPFPTGVVFRFQVSDSLAPATFNRTGTATFTALVPDELFTFAVGASLSSATFARTGDATFTAEVP